MPQPAKLGKDKPHPMAAFFSRAQFRTHLLENRILRIHKSLQVIKIVAVRHCSHMPPALGL